MKKRALVPGLEHRNRLNGLTGVGIPSVLAKLMPIIPDIPDIKLESRILFVFAGKKYQVS